MKTRHVTCTASKYQEILTKDAYLNKEEIQEEVKNFRTEEIARIGWTVYHLKQKQQTTNGVS